MTLALFIILTIILCGVSGLLTQGIKMWFQNAGKDYSANLIALIDAIIVGVGGTVAAYIIWAIPFTLVNIVYIPIMALAIWIGSMIGYDKVLQFIKQLKDLK